MSKLLTLAVLLVATTAVLAFDGLGAFPSIALPNTADATAALQQALARDAPPALRLRGTKGGCKSQTQAVGPCSVVYNVCLGFHRFHVQYSATACVGGVCGSAGGFQSSGGAAETATYNLFVQRPSCACSSSAVPVGKCSFGVTGCFEFASAAAVQNKQPSYFANVTDPQTGVWADYCCASDATDAVKAAAQALSQKESIARCY